MKTQVRNIGEAQAVLRSEIEKYGTIIWPNSLRINLSHNPKDFTRMH